jgi:hypothetical protein
MSKLAFISYVLSIVVATGLVIFFTFSFIAKYKRRLRQAARWADIHIGNNVFSFFGEAFKRIFFLLNTDVYTKDLKAKIKSNDRSKLDDLGRQLTLASTDRDHWRVFYYEQQDATNKNYWNGFKDGHKVGEQKKSKDASQSSDWWTTPEAQDHLHTLIKAHLPIKLTKPQLYSLYQLSKGNHHITFNAGFLVSIGFARLHWDDDRFIRHHYTITDYGHLYLKKNPLETFQQHGE